MVDRNAIIRITGGEKVTTNVDRATAVAAFSPFIGGFMVAERVRGEERTVDNDMQRVEMAALKGFADLVVEILMTRDKSSPTGFLFRATVKDVNNGQLVADVSATGAKDASGAKEFVATDRGFEARPVPGSNDVDGTRVAVAVMDRLTQLWGR